MKASCFASKDKPKINIKVTVYPSGELLLHPPIKVAFGEGRMPAATTFLTVCAVNAQTCLNCYASKLLFLRDFSVLGQNFVYGAAGFVFRHFFNIGVQFQFMSRSQFI